MIRRLPAGLAAAVLIGASMVTAAGPAAAHSVPVSSVPADGARVDAGPERVSITFNENLQTGFPAMTVVGPPDRNLWSKGQPSIDGATLSVAVGALGPVGTYTVAYRVTSADGHPVSGTRTFTLTTPGDGTPGPKADAEQHGSGGVPVWVFIVIAAVVLGGGLAYALFGGGGRRKDRV